MEKIMAPKNPLRIAFFVDGFTLKKVNEYYRFFHPYHTRLDFRGLRSWARHEALKLFSPKSSFCTMECHYYHPYKRPGDYASACGLKGLERELHHGGFNVHYAESVGNDRFTPNLGLIDDALMFAAFGRMDVAVLFSTQGQFSIFPERLRAVGVKTLVLGWNFAYPKADRWVNWQTDSGLRESCDYYVAMEHIANKYPPVPEGRVGLFLR
jgi:hypothetical protein